jgi:hypothetical protein
MDSKVQANQKTSKAGKPLPDFADFVTCLAPYLDGGQPGYWRLLGLRRKLRKLIVEFEVKTEDGAGVTGRRYIAKGYHGDRGRHAFDALSQLWQAGFRPPSTFTVVRPIAYIAERHLLVQEKAPGRPLADVLGSDPEAAADALVGTANWLAALHATAVHAQSRLGHVRAAVGRYGRELMELLPQQAARIERLTACALAGLEPRCLAPQVPSHGDFHAKNVFIDDSGQVTALDLDTFGGQERAADVAYFLAQTAIRGYFHHGSFAITAWARQCFLRAYQEAAQPLPRKRLALYLGMSFLQSLHYERCVLHTGNAAILEPWLGNSERCLLDGELPLLEEPIRRG